MAPAFHPRRRRPRAPQRGAGRAVALGLVAALVLAACGVEAGDRAVAPIRSDSGDVVGSGVSDAPTTAAPSTTVPPVSDLAVQGLVDSAPNRAITAAIGDLEEFWADAYPDAYGFRYRPLEGGLYAIGSDTDPRSIPCSPATIEEILDNAYYCPADDAVVWDQEIFMPAMAERYGLFTVAVVIAHEWGHVIQERSRLSAPSVIFELQADCFAGAWVGHVAAGNSPFSVTTDDLDQALAGILSLRDAPGGRADDPYAHGSGFDRVGAFQDGFEAGVGRCAEYRDGDPTPYQFPFATAGDYESNGDLPLIGPAPDDDIIDLAFPALDGYWNDVFPTLSGGDRWLPLGAPVAFSPGQAPECGGDPVDGFVLFVCIPDRYIGFEMSETIPAAYEQNGDFAVATLFATQYGLDVVEQLGSADDELAATLQGDCLAGAWAGDSLPSGEEPRYQLVLSPGDLDEAVAVLLSFRSDTDRERQGPGFDRVRAFRQGVIGGVEVCPEIDGP